jgi:hypothetical protein
MQELAADLFGDMLLNGARREETELLLNALLIHQWHRDFPDWPRDPVAALEHARDFARKRYDETHGNLVAAWPKKPAAPEEPTPKTLTEKIRYQTRDTVRTLFEDFMGSASPEELSLMRDIFTERDSYHLPADSNPVQEIYLATAIESATGGYGATHIKVPRKMVPLIEKLVAARQEIEQKEECA